MIRETKKRISYGSMVICALATPWVIWAALGGRWPHAAIATWFVFMVVGMHFASELAIEEIKEWKRNAPKCPTCGKIK